MYSIAISSACIVRICRYSALPARGYLQHAPQALANVVSIILTPQCAFSMYQPHTNRAKRKTMRMRRANLILREDVGVNALANALAKHWQCVGHSIVG